MIILESNCKKHLGLIKSYIDILGVLIKLS